MIICENNQISKNEQLIFFMRSKRNYFNLLYYLSAVLIIKDIIFETE